MAPARQLHVWRYLGALLAAIVGMYGLILAQDLTPKLGLDLQGGAFVILSPEEGSRATGEQVDQAVNIIRRRVDGVGVAEAEVVTQGQNIVISVPGVGREAVRKLGSTAQLRFREVIQTAPGAPVPEPPATPAPSGSATPAPSGSAVPPPSGSATPTPAATPGGTATPSAASARALSRALLAGAAPTTPPAAPPATPPAATAPPVTPPVVPPATPPVAPGIQPDPALLERFATLDCTTPEARQGTGSTDDPAKQLVGCEQDGSGKYLLAPAKVIGTDVKGATAQLDPSGTSSAWQILVSFTGQGQRKFTELTRETTGKQVAIVLDGVVISAPTIQDTISGDAQITGTFKQAEAKDLANVLRYGALPLTFTTSQAETISASLGGDQLRAGLLAGGLGLLLVVLYSFLYYRALGIVVIASLTVAGALTYAAVVILGRQAGLTLTLAGIAGLIVSIGITADSFVVYFERVKDEVREGRSLRTAVDRGWVRARRTVLSADFVSFLGAVILYFLSVGAVRGFAFMLGLATVIDIVVVFLFTRPVMALLVRYRLFKNPRVNGLGAVMAQEQQPSAGRRALRVKGA